MRLQLKKDIMKHLLSYIAVIICSSINAQTLDFKVDCGNDTIFCRSLYADTLHLGSQVKLTNGVAPFAYKWSCKRYKIDNILNLTAKDFLNDTTLLNPYFKSYPIGSDCLYFYLTVEDSSGKQANDSITVRFSQFSYLEGYLQIELNIGDSVEFLCGSVGGGIPPLKLYWTPITGLSDTAGVNIWCKPDKSTDYETYVIDSVGCRSNPNLMYSIIIKPTLIKTNNFVQSIDAYQNGNRIVFNNPQNRLAIITLYTLDGKKIYESETKGSIIEIDNSLSQNGIYIYNLKVQNEFVSGKYINNKVKHK